MIKTLSVLLRLVTIGALTATLLLSQIETARIQGTVLDASGAVIPGATVRFIQVSTNRVLQTETSVEGFYQSPPLRIGEYQLEVESEGFKRAIRSGIVLELQQTAESTFRLSSAP